MEVGSTLPQKMLVVDHVIVRLIPARTRRSLRRFGRPLRKRLGWAVSSRARE